MKEKYIEECAFIQQNCTYTAEAHHQMALSAKCQSVWFGIVPSVCAVLSGAAVAVGIWSDKIIFITLISSIVVAVSTVLNPNKTYQLHLEAAQGFTALKHDARFMREAISQKLSDDAFSVAVENLHSRYNDLLRAVPPTSPKAFAKAQKTVQSGTHDPDRDPAGKIK